MFDLDTAKGKGSHYAVRVGERFTILQKTLDAGRIARALKQLDIDPADL